MEKIYAKARAKVNLTLEILDKREDGYHNLKSVFQKINLYDEIFIEKIEKDECQIKTNINDLKLVDNIIYKAYLKLKEKYSDISGIKVTLNKKIPMQAGLAGGSTDCASFILAMNKLFNLNMSKNDLISLGKSLGADVVPCFYERAVLAEGIGDIITKIKTNFKYYLVIVKPEFSCDTKEMFKKLDSCHRKINTQNTDQVIKALETNNIKLLSNNLYNSFENVVYNGKIEKIKAELCSNSLLSGSGSCVYGIFENKNEAKKVYQKLKEKYEVYICTSYNKLMENIL